MHLSWALRILESFLDFESPQQHQENEEEEAYRPRSCLNFFYISSLFGGTFWSHSSVAFLIISWLALTLPYLISGSSLESAFLPLLQTP